MSDSLYNNYFVDDAYDEMLSESMQVNPNWEGLLDKLNRIGKIGLQSRQNDINWHLLENGVTYNVYNDPEGLNRPWNLNVIPNIINEHEWETVEKGLKQRAEILNLVLKDLYGERQLIKNGIIPQEVIFSHRGFIRHCDQIKYNTPKNLLIHAVDMARGPDGRMWIVNDRTQAPSGMGYALENRLTMGRVMPDIFKDMSVRKLSGFFQQFNNLLIESSPRQIENPNIVILTPGPHNETYFEHAYLASFLGYPLVQGNDLIVRDGYLWMKSLKGLKQIDVVLRRVDDMYVDPLELREDSQLGVAGLLDVVRRNNVAIVNPIGSRILENPGIIPFMKGIAKYFLGEDLILPQIATWWCGQDNERKYVLKNIDHLIIKRIDRSSNDSIYFGYEMSSQQQEVLIKQIIKRPYRFVAQEKISFSTTPTFINNSIEPCKSVWRGFSIAQGNEYVSMPGGLVRVAPEKGTIVVSNQTGGTSKDIWIIGRSDEKSVHTLWHKKSAVSASGIDDLPSLTAENLYWAGRYVSRTLSTARFIRMVLKQMTFIQSNERKPSNQGLGILFQALTHLTATYPGFVGENFKDHLKEPFPEILSVILDNDRMGSLTHSISMFKQSFYSIRNLWSSDMWRVFERIDHIWRDLLQERNFSVRRLIEAMDQLITRLIAFMGLIEESILIDQGLLLYYIGLRMEMSMHTISKCRSLLTIKHNEQTEYEILESLLNSHESLNIYRFSYRSYITIENVIDLLILDLKYPRSIAFKLNRLNKDLAGMPHSKTYHELTDYEKMAFKAFSKIRLTGASELSAHDYNMFRKKLDDLLSDLGDLLFETSNSISNTYFSHTDKQNQLVVQNFAL